MRNPAIKDPDFPDGGGSGCGESTLEGMLINLKPCEFDNTLYYRLKIGDIVEIDLNPDRVFIKVKDTVVKVEGNKTEVTTKKLIVNGDVEVSGSIKSEGNITSTSDVRSQGGRISLTNHKHKFRYQTAGGEVTSTTGTPEET